MLSSTGWPTGPISIRRADRPVDTPGADQLPRVHRPLQDGECNAGTWIARWRMFAGPRLEEIVANY